jgi:glycosyltransferase involved in cell wall biosynthesis
MILINASNLHHGGGVQAATSVILEVLSERSLKLPLTFWVSTEIDRNLRSAGVSSDILKNYFVVDSYGLKFVYSDLARKLPGFDVVLTIFGPLYTFENRFVNITGFAQPWIAYPCNEVYQSLSLFDRVKAKLKFAIQKWFFLSSDVLIVELEHVKSALYLNVCGPDKDIVVINNSISQVFKDKSLWESVSLPPRTGKIRLGFLGKGYKHKNLSIFPEIARILKQTYKIEVQFVVTFDESEWLGSDSEFRNVCDNVGVLTNVQCPSFYESVDAVIFPSLLECFSVTPLEAMAMRKPLFVSDRPFNRDICKEYGFYFDPLDPKSAAQVIADTLGRPIIDSEFLDAAERHALSFPGPKDRALAYLRCIADAYTKL